MFAAGSRHGAEDMEGVSHHELLLSRGLLHVLHVNLITRGSGFEFVSAKYIFNLALSGDDDPFIVLTETKFSFRCIPVWIGTLLTGLGSKKKKKKTHVIMFSP